MKDNRSLSRQSQDIIGRSKTGYLIEIIKDFYRKFSWILLGQSLTLFSLRGSLLWYLS